MPVDDSGETTPPKEKSGGVAPPLREGSLQEAGQRPRQEQAPLEGGRYQPSRRWSRLSRRKRASYVALAATGSVLLIAVIAVLLLRTGTIDTIIANQVIETLSEYGIRAETKSFRIRISPRTVEISDLELFDAKSGERIARVNRLLATVRINDLFALNLKRNINLESLTLENPEAWITFDAAGRSNLSNLHIPPPDPNQRILFSYSTARVKLLGGVIHYGDARHEISGEARNVHGTVEPDDLNAPTASSMDRVSLAMSGSSLTYDGRPVNGIDVEAEARVNQTRVEIKNLELRTPLAEAHIQGTMDDWRALHYQLQVTSNVDLEGVSALLQPGASVRGSGQFAGNISGEGSHYRLEGALQSDDLTAEGVRIRSLSLPKLTATGDGASYDVQANVIAEMLNSGNFQLNSVQLAGGVMGTGTDFRWLGELKAAALREGNLTISGLALNDAMAESRDERISGSSGELFAERLNLRGASSVTGSRARVSGLEFTLQQNGDIAASAKGLQTGNIKAGGAGINSVTTGKITAERSNNSNKVEIEDVRLGPISGTDYQTGSLNIAGVRLAISEGGAVTGSSSDIDAGNLALKVGGQSGAINGLRVAHPVFSVTPSGSYRASADLSLGGGILGQMKFGKVQSAVLAQNNEISLNRLDANILQGQVQGNAAISTTNRGLSRVALKFAGLDVTNLLELTGRVVPVSAQASGALNLNFPGTDFAGGSGNLSAQFTGETSGAPGAAPLSGDLSLIADGGLFRIGNADIRTPASEVKASGEFSLIKDSDLQINVTSSDAGELERIVMQSGLIPGLERTASTVGINVAGNLSFEGSLRGKISEPNFEGHAAVGSVLLKGSNLGALSMNVDSTSTDLRVSDGKLTQPGGGNAQFTFDVPFHGHDNISLQATLDRLDTASLLTPLIGATVSGQSALATAGADRLASLGPASGSINVTGIPGAMNGTASVRAGPGNIGVEPVQEMTARVNLNGSILDLQNLTVRLGTGQIVADARVDIGALSLGSRPDSSLAPFDIHVRATGVHLDLLEQIAGGGGFPLSGTTDVTASASGNLLDTRSYQVSLNGEGHNVEINGKPAGALTLAGKTENQRFDLTLTTGLLGQPQVLTATIDFSKSELPASFETDFNNADLTSLLTTFMPAGANVRLSGKATGSLKASGNLRGAGGYSIAGLHGTANFGELTVQVADVQLAAASPLIVQFSPSEVTFEKTRFTGPGTNVLFGGTAALATGGRQNFSVDGQLNLAVLNTLSPGNFFNGIARVSVRVGGSFAQPRLNGTAGVNNGSFSALLSGERITLADVNGSILFNENQAQIQSLTASLGQGKVSVTGGSLLEDFLPSTFRFNVRGDNVTVPLPYDIRASADARLTIQGTPQANSISGNATLRRAEYTRNIDIADLINRRPEVSMNTGGGAAFGGTTILNVNVQGRDSLIVRNNLADVVGSLAVQVRGTIEDPLISGRISLSHGTLNFRNDRYEITRAYVDLPEQRDADPVIDIQAESEIRGYRVIVGLTGPVSQPEAVLRSEPSLPEADVVSLVTTGNLASGTQSASTLAQSGVGTAASLLTGALINAPAQRATDKLFGLNRFEIDPLLAGRSGSSPTARITLGRQINRNLSVTYSTNVTADQNQLIALNYRVSDRLSFVAQYEQAPVSELGTQRNNSFSFEIRFRRRF